MLIRRLLQRGPAGVLISSQQGPSSVSVESRRGYDVRNSPPWVPLTGDPFPPGVFETDDPKVQAQAVFSPNTKTPTKTLLDLALINSKKLAFEAREANVISNQDPILEEDYFNLRSLIKMEELFTARVFWGHKVGTLHPKMKQYLYGERLGTCVFDLDRTEEELFKALNFIAHIVYRGGVVLFVTANRWAMRKVEESAQKVGEYSHTRKWRDGLWTNFKDSFRGEIRFPDVIVMVGCLNSVFELHPAIIEASKVLIPIVGVTDSNVDPSFITYPIPGNDDTKESIDLYLKLFEKTIRQAKKARNRDFKESLPIGHKLKPDSAYIGLPPEKVRDLQESKQEEDEIEPEDFVEKRKKLNWKNHRDFGNDSQTKKVEEQAKLETKSEKSGENQRKQPVERAEKKDKVKSNANLGAFNALDDMDFESKTKY